MKRALIAAALFFAGMLPAHGMNALGVRRVQSNNLFTCNGKMYESHLSGGNSYYARSIVTLACLVSPVKARWIIKAGSYCNLMEGQARCKVNHHLFMKSDYITFSHTENIPRNSPITNHYTFHKGVLGEYCDLIQDRGNDSMAWRCEKYAFLQKTSLTTISQEPLVLDIRFYDSFLKSDGTHPIFWKDILGVGEHYLTNHNY